jgi:AcrR family transcriptional regulator
MQVFAVIHDHFPSKAKLQVELLERQTAALLDHVGRSLEESPHDPAERLRIGVGAFFAYVESTASPGGC